MRDRRAASLLLLSLALPAAPLGAARLEVSPSSHDFGNVPAGQRKIVTIRVANEGLLARTVPVRSSSPHVTVSDTSLAIPGKRSVSLSVAISDKAPAGALSATVTIDDGKDAVRVEVRANVQAAPTPKPTAALASPTLGVTPAALDFGSVDLDQSKSLSFTVTGSQASPCTVTAFSAAGYPAWQPAPASLSLSPGQPATVSVAFTAKVLLQNLGGSSTGRITVTCGSSKATVDLKGATPLARRFKITVVRADGTQVNNGPPRPGDFAGLVAGKAPGDPQNAFGQVLACAPGSDDPGQCTGLAKAGVKVDLNGSCLAGKPFRWARATGSAASCQGSSSPLCSFVIDADTTVAPACGP